MRIGEHCLPLALSAHDFSSLKDRVCGCAVCRGQIPGGRLERAARSRIVFSPTRRSPLPRSAASPP